MCMKDVTDARQRYVQQSIITIGVPGTIKPNRKRVCVSFCLITANAADSAYVSLTGQTDNATTIATLTFASPIAVFRIEDFGSLVTGQFGVGIASGIAVTITEVLIDDATTPTI